MSILNNTIKISVADSIRNINTNNYDRLKQGIERSFYALNNAVDIQAVLDDFGTNASSLFETFRKTVEFLTFINPDYVAPVTENKYQFNLDGSITYIKPVESEEELEIK